VGLICSLENLTRADLGVAGGKGSNLGEMARAGLPVPPGFVLTTDAYRAFVAHNELTDTILANAGSVDPGDGATLKRASEQIQAAFAAGDVPQPIRLALERAYAQLGGGPVAVRSSATAEDLPGASFAGQQDTYLYREGFDDVTAAVRLCWASLWSARAMAYRSEQRIAPQDISLAVVVQVMVPAQAAGVLFTANPVNGRRDQMVVDAAWGLGEAVVSGRVVPDRWVIDGVTGQASERTIASKEVITVPRLHGTETVPLEDARRDEPALSEAQIEALVGLGRRAADHFGSPQDIEWALVGGDIFLVQSRPITSLFPLPAPPPSPADGLRVYVCHTLIQGVVEPFTPMGLSLLAELQRHNRAINGAQLEPKGAPVICKVAAGRLFIDVTDALRHPLLGSKLLFILGRVEPGTAGILRQLVDREPALAQRKQGLPGSPMSLGQAMVVIGQMLGAMANPERSRAAAVARIEASIGEIRHEADGIGTPGEARAFALRSVARVRDLLLPLFAPLGVGMLGHEGAQALLRKAPGLDHDALVAAAMRSLPNNPTTEMDLELWRVSRRLREDGASPDPEHPAVASFLDKYGHRALREIDAGMPRWGDEPAYVLQVLQNYLSHGEEADADRRFATGQAQAQVAVAALVNDFRRTRGRLRARFLQKLLDWARALEGLRETPKFYTVQLLAIVRGALLRAGSAMAAHGLLAKPEDVFWLHVDEVREVDAGDKSGDDPDGRDRADLTAIVAERKVEYQRELTRRRVPRVVTSTGETLYEPALLEEDGDITLSGTAASPGTCEGYVRVILQPEGAKLRAGEVLVAPGTDPAWTPLFLTAGALVTETGGPNSHGAVVAREFGIPAVVSVRAAASVLRTGQRVRVDGGTGRVTVLEPLT
jgi:pyruvate,water dikinase